MDRSALRAKRFIRASGDFRAATLSNCGLRRRSLLHYRGKISKNLTIDELPKGGRRPKEDFENGKHCYAMHGQSVLWPTRPEQRPKPEILEWHRMNSFLG
jgi:hypothetical protein